MFPSGVNPSSLGPCIKFAPIAFHHAAFEPMCVSSKFSPDRTFWLDKAIQCMDDVRKHTFQCHASKDIRFGSDCTGADSAFQAGGEWVEHLKSNAINEFASEAPDAYACMLLQLLNHQPKVLYSDVLARGTSGYCVVAGKLVPTPDGVDLYSAGTMCTDYSHFNTLNPKKQLGLPLFFSLCFFVFAFNVCKTHASFGKGPDERC